MSPWGPSDELGRLNLMTPESRARVLSGIDGGKVYDLSVEYFIGMPSWQAAGDPHYRLWMTHTPRHPRAHDLLSQQGVPILEVVNLEELARDEVWEFAFIGGSLKLRGADAAPMRPIALPLDSRDGGSG